MAAGIIAVSLLAILLPCTQTNAQACKEGWSHFNGNCYGYGDTPVSWTEAATICSVVGATLAEVESVEENEFLISLFDNVTSSTRVWLGGTDILNEGNWVWVSTRRHIFPYQNWHSNQPSDSNSAGEDCLSMYSSYDFEWDDAQCNKVSTFICEKKSEGISANLKDEQDFGVETRNPLSLSEEVISGAPVSNCHTRRRPVVPIRDGGKRKRKKTVLSKFLARSMWITKAKKTDDGVQ